MVSNIEKDTSGRTNCHEKKTLSTLCWTNNISSGVISLCTVSVFFVNNYNVKKSVINRILVEIIQS